MEVHLSVGLKSALFANTIAQHERLAAFRETFALLEIPLSRGLSCKRQPTVNTPGLPTGE